MTLSRLIPTILPAMVSLQKSAQASIRRGLLLEHIAALIGCLHLGRTTVCVRCFDNFTREDARSAAHVRKVERNPCVVRSLRPILRSAISSAMLDKAALSRSPGKTYIILANQLHWTPENLQTAASLNGTRCSRRSLHTRFGDFPDFR